MLRNSSEQLFKPAQRKEREEQHNAFGLEPPYGDGYKHDLPELQRAATLCLLSFVTKPEMEQRALFCPLAERTVRMRTPAREVCTQSSVAKLRNYGEFAKNRAKSNFGGLTAISRDGLAVHELSLATLRSSGSRKNESCVAG